MGEIVGGCIAHASTLSPVRVVDVGSVNLSYGRLRVFFLCNEDYLASTYMVVVSGERFTQ